MRTRPTSGVEFPGCAAPCDLDLLYSDTNPAKEHTLTEADIVALRKLHKDLRRICTRAQERGVRVVVDAEYTWYQPAIDALTLALSREFNRLPARPSMFTSWWPRAAKGGASQDKSMGHGEQPLVYATYQAYLRRTPAQLQHDLALAHREGFALGVKLVRGAYHGYEIAQFEQPPGTGKSIAPPAPLPPVWLAKAESDECYDACARAMVRAVAAAPGAGPAVMFGTHNWASCEGVLREMVDAGLARVEVDRVRVMEAVEGRVTFGQLYGAFLRSFFLLKDDG